MEDRTTSAVSQAKLLGMLQNFVSTPSKENDADQYSIAGSNSTQPNTPRLGFR